MTEDSEAVEAEGERQPAACPLCWTPDDSADPETGTNRWRVCIRCGHRWAYAVT